MPILPAVLIVSLLAASDAPSQGDKSIQSRSVRIASRSVLEEQGRLVVLCVGQTALPTDLNGRQRAMISRVAKTLRAGGSTTAIQGTWRTLIGDLHRTNRSTDVQSLVQWVIRESYLETVKDLRMHADRVRFFNDAKRRIRSHLKEVRGALSRAGAQNRLTVQSLRLRSYAKDASAVVPAGTRRMQRRELTAYIATWETKLNQVGDDAQLANMDLQNVLQKQQQLVQMMSNMSKFLHDTAMAVIRNMK